jgi:hypothetical protein
VFKDNIALPLSACNPEAATPKVSGKEGAWLRARIERGHTERFAVIIKVSPRLAAEMLLLNSRNRSLSPKRVTKYAAAMTEGRWRLTSESISISKTGALLNGQHRLSAILEAAHPVDMTIWFGAADEEFAYIDQGASRTAGDLASIRGLTYATQRAALAGRVLKLEMRTSATMDANRVDKKAVEMVGPDTDAALHFGERARKVVNAGAASLAYYWIYQNSPHKNQLEIFWDHLVKGANLTEGSPILRVRDLFKGGAILAKTHRDRTIKEAAAIILAWNAWLAKRRRSTFEWDHVIELPEVS